VVLLALAGCGAPGQDEGLGVVGGIDTSQAGLTSFLTSKGYAGWTAEPAIHATSGPHGAKVRVFFNEALVTAARAGTTPLPKGAATVKELYDANETLTGYAIDLKIADGAGKDTWLFYEGFAPAYDQFYGVAHPTCHGCHESGKDYLLSTVP
jgi:hypothetical protein